ncbi:ABC transporter ATP-binding protein [Actinophytocola sp.]|uniref:ABC transporter ATP-binding protein n=1 Tax=Actinophytocola sp. TaxID=1872138 RepID=UPI002ED2B56F
MSAAYAAVRVLDAACAIALPATLASAVDAALGRVPTATALVWLCVVLVAATTAELVAELVEVRVVTAATAGLRRRIVDHVLRLDLRGQRRFPDGDLLSRLLEGTTETGRAVPVAAGAAVSGLTSIAGIVALLVIDLWTGLVFLAGAPLVLLLANGFLRRVTVLTQDYQRIQGELATRLLGAIRGIRTVRAAGTVNREVDRVLAPLPALRASGRAFWLAQRDIGWRLSLIAPALQVGVLATAGYGVWAGRVSPGALIAVGSYLGYAMGVLRQLGVLGQFGRVRGSAQRVAEALDIVPASSGTARFPASGRGAVRMRGIQLVIDGHVVLDDIDLDVPAGASVAVVGVSGTGKSSLAAIAGGLLQPDAGTVTIDGVDLAVADPDELPRAVAHAFERPVLLGDTVGDAITFGDHPTGQDAVTEALRASDAAEFVARLPQRLDTPVDTLHASGGEYQRLGLARAFSREPRLLVLDDALSSVDTITERRITGALGRQRATRIVVTARISTASNADLVVWLHDGRVAATGPHQTLLAEPGYRELFGGQLTEARS